MRRKNSRTISRNGVKVGIRLEGINIKRGSILKSTGTIRTNNSQSHKMANLVRIQAMLFKHPIDQKTTPSIRQAVVKHAEKPIQGMAISDEHFATQRKAERAYGVSIAKPISCVLKRRQSFLRHRQNANMFTMQENVKTIDFEAFFCKNHLSHPPLRFSLGNHLVN